MMKPQSEMEDKEERVCCTGEGQRTTDQQVVPVRSSWLTQFYTQATRERRAELLN